MGTHSEDGIHFAIHTHVRTDERTWTVRPCAISIFGGGINRICDTLNRRRRISAAQMQAAEGSKEHANRRHAVAAVKIQQQKNTTTAAAVAAVNAHHACERGRRMFIMTFIKVD